jgi:hypothetical protein
MFPEKSQFGRWVVGVVVAVYAVSNPVSAAHMVNALISAIGRFANALG